jgi:hypothetical protein
VLVRALQTAGEDFSQFPDLEDYTVFAVQYRYEAYDETEGELDRDSVVKKTGEFVAYVQALIDSSP